MVLNTKRREIIVHLNQKKKKCKRKLSIQNKKKLILRIRPGGRERSQNYLVTSAKR